MSTKRKLYPKIQVRNLYAKKQLWTGIVHQYMTSIISALFSILSITGLFNLSEDNAISNYLVSCNLFIEYFIFSFLLHKDVS